MANIPVTLNIVSHYWALLDCRVMDYQTNVLIDYQSNGLGLWLV